jgi:hypothetical protein
MGQTVAYPPPRWLIICVVNARRVDPALRKSPVGPHWWNGFTLGEPGRNAREILRASLFGSEISAAKSCLLCGFQCQAGAKKCQFNRPFGAFPCVSWHECVLSNKP